jgi:hypothetical protein
MTHESTAPITQYAARLNQVAMPFLLDQIRNTRDAERLVAFRGTVGKALRHAGTHVHDKQLRAFALP